MWRIDVCGNSMSYRACRRLYIDPSGAPTKCERATGAEEIWEIHMVSVLICMYWPHMQAKRCSALINSRLISKTILAKLRTILRNIYITSMSTLERQNGIRRTRTSQML